MSDRKPRTNLLLLAALFIVEVSVVVIMLCWYKRGERLPSEFLRTDAGLVFLAAAVLSALSLTVILHQYLHARSKGTREFYFTVLMNLIAVCIAVAGSEIGVGLLANRLGDEERILGRVLLPRSWNHAVNHNRDMISTGLGHLSYLLYDEGLGWTVGPNRRSANGLYFSSIEGVRAPRQDVAFSVSSRQPRIALVGDSFTFGEEVPYEETWGDFLEKELSGKFSILNFGVPGYGVDQAYLRYERDARAWKPEVVVLGFISNDLYRSMAVYALLMFPDFPFSKPRFVLRDGTLVTLNVPPIAPDVIFSKRAVLDLPFLEYDHEFHPSEWQGSLLDFLRVPRLLRSLFPLWRNRSEDSYALLAVNAAIMESFAQAARRAGAEPILVFFPDKPELANPDGGVPLGKRALQLTGLAYTDMTPCLSALPPGERFMKGNHYTPRANSAVAKCLAPVVRDALSRRTMADTQAESFRGTSRDGARSIRR